MRKRGLLVTAAISFVALAHPADATSIVQIDQGAFQAGAGLITFSEPSVPLGTQNPTYTPSMYGGGAGSPTVTFGGFFTGQSAGSTNPSACPAGAAVSGCVLGSPTGPLTLDPNSPATFTAGDGAQPTSPILSGSPLFNGSIAVEFSTPQSGVGLIGGFFNAVGSTAITAYDANGNVIGSVTNNQTGDEFLGLVTSDDSAIIAGLLFHLVGDEPFGFDIDNVQFGVGAQVIVPSVPLPATLPLFGAGLGVLGVFSRRRKRKAAAIATA